MNNDNDDNGCADVVDSKRRPCYFHRQHSPVSSYPMAMSASSETAAATEPCASCGKDSGKRCTRCRAAFYCDAECQRSDWKRHKKVCFPEGAECTRCLEVIDVAKPCKVPHPTHMLTAMGSSHGGGNNSWSFRCEACTMSFVKESSDFNGMDTAPIARGAMWCYSGPHTVKPLRGGDERRICRDSLVLHAGPDLQEQIDGIPSTMPDVRSLVIQSTGGYDDSIHPSLEVPMPKLEKIKLIDVAFSSVKLNMDLTPSVEELFMQNISDDCALAVQLSELKSFCMYYYGPPEDDAWIHEMLAAAKKLRTFDSYKLRIEGTLDFAGNDLRSVGLHRAECLQSLRIYAPNLRDLNLQACYGLIGDLTILDDHPNFARPAGDHSSINVNTTNACISQAISHTLKNHPRVVWDGEGESDDEYGFGY